MSIFTTKITTLLATAAGAAVLSFAPSLASARPHFDDVTVGVAINPQPCAPVCVDQVDRVWVEPTYRTVCERVWVEPVTQEREVHSWVPDRFEVQDVVYQERHHRVVRQENVLVEPAHDVCEKQCIVVTPGHFEDVQRQEVACPGHFEERVRPVIVEQPHHDRLDIIGGWFRLH